MASAHCCTRLKSPTRHRVPDHDLSEEPRPNYNHDDSVTHAVMTPTHRQANKKFKYPFVSGLAELTEERYFTGFNEVALRARLVKWTRPAESNGQKGVGSTLSRHQPQQWSQPPPWLQSQLCSSALTLALPDLAPDMKRGSWYG